MNTFQSSVKVLQITKISVNGLSCAITVSNFVHKVECDLSGMAAINFLRIPSMPFDENTYVLYKEGLTSCVVVDPGFEPEKIVEALEERKLEIAAILNTHGHSDHIAGNGAMKKLAPEAPLVIGWGDAVKLTDPDKNLSGPFGLPLVSPAEDATVKEGDVYSVADIDFEVRETPGHSSGHVVFIVRDSERTIVLGGDVLFKGSIGRTDFPDGSFADLKQAIEEKLFTLPADSVILPGHGPATTVGDEIEANPFVGRSAGYRG